MVGLGEGDAARQHGPQPRGEGQVPDRSGCPGLGQDVKVDTHRRECCQVQVLAGRTGLLGIDAEYVSNGRIVEQAEKQVVGPDAAVPTPSRLFSSMH